jgi:hypothetical protein
MNLDELRSVVLQNVSDAERDAEREALMRETLVRLLIARSGEQAERLRTIAVLERWLRQSADGEP